MKRYISLMVIAILGTLPFAAQARHGKGKGRMPPVIVKQALRDAGLSDQQIRGIMVIKDEADRTMLDIRHEVHKAQLDMRQLMLADTPDQAAIFSQVDKIGALKLKLHKTRIGMMLSVRKEVTPEQWEKLSVLFAERKMKKRGQRKQRRRDRKMKRGF